MVAKYIDPQMLVFDVRLFKQDSHHFVQVLQFLFLKCYTT